MDVRESCIQREPLARCTERIKGNERRISNESEPKWYLFDKTSDSEVQIPRDLGEGPSDYHC